MPSKKLFHGYYALRWSILERDNYTCRYCGQHAPNVMLEVDHRIPVSEGGSDHPDNLVTSCFACNRGKNGLAIIQKYKKRPFKPYIPPRPQAWRRDMTFNYISEHPGLSTKELSAQLNLTRSYADVLLNRLRVLKCIKRENNRWFIT